jgi:prolyl-tRNA synthetase
MTSTDADAAERIDVDDRFEADGLLTAAGEAPAAQPTVRHTLRDLSRALLTAEILDTRSIALPGAAVTLPWGVALLRRFRAVVTEQLDAYGYEEYEFPELAPPSVYEPAIAAFPKQQQLLGAGSDEDWAAGRPRAILMPTGEASVYTHWARTVRSTTDLPVRMRRNARYFRPVPRGARSGRGIYRPLEAPDVHEWHACVVDDRAAEAELSRALEMAAAITRQLHVPVLWSRRPPWGNNAEIARRCFGGDTVLPSGGTIQVACVYDQGALFARAYDIRMRDTTPHRHPRHVTGCVTRRLLIAHLQQHLDDHNAVQLDPDLSPVQVAVRSTDRASVEPLYTRLAGEGFRVHFDVADRDELARVRAGWRRRGVPVVVLVQPPRGPADPVRIVVETAADEQRALVDSASAAADLVARAVAAETRRIRTEVEARTAARVRQCHDLATARECVDGGLVAVAAAAPERAATAELEHRVGGEVIGFRLADDGAPALVGTGSTRVRALLARRG